MCLSRERAVDGLQWDALAPCLRPASVDVIISDLPFGKRSGSKADNRVLYPATLLAMARLVRPTTGIVLGYLTCYIFKSKGGSKFGKNCGKSGVCWIHMFLGHRFHKSEIRILLSSNKKCKKNIDSYCFVTSLCLFSLKNDVNVPSKSNIQQKFC
jgi:hypothetical protein